MLGIFASAMRIATRTEKDHDAAMRRYRAKQEAEQRNREYYRRWLLTSKGRW
ncbi:hypothetical protein [Profundibacter sp.]|uniref:hypothetical protein n=1 Tax=Profundibacter sp. TaxID=3101071 RepID=UPI003D12F27B